MDQMLEEVDRRLRLILAGDLSLRPGLCIGLASMMTGCLHDCGVDRDAWIDDLQLVSLDAPERGVHWRGHAIWYPGKDRECSADPAEVVLEADPSPRVRLRCTFRFGDADVGIAKGTTGSLPRREPRRWLHERVVELREG